MYLWNSIVYNCQTSPGNMRLIIQNNAVKKLLQLPFIITFVLLMAAAIKYHGLFNQGATCYLNSVLQVLFMTKDFREAVERCACESSDNEHLDLHLKDLFKDLERDTAHVTCKIINKLGINKVYEQRDAAEYYEKILSQTSADASRIFHAELTHKTICSECGTEESTDALVWHLPLALLDSYSEEYNVANGIEDYFRDSHFSGLDQMYCDQCDHKVNVTIKCEVKTHPVVLVLLLKRFEFNYNYMTYDKNNRFVIVPYMLQIPQNQTYELYAVVDHVGDLRGGHYTATIRPQNNNQWFIFDDSRVELHGYQPFQGDKCTEKSQTAQLLFYRKRQSMNTSNQDFREASATGDKQREEVEPAVEVGDDTSETVSIEKHEEAGKRDEVIDESTREEPMQLDPNECYVEDQDNKVNVSVPNTEKYNGEEEADEGTISRGDEEDIGRQAEVGDQEEKRVSDVMSDEDKQTDSHVQSDKVMTDLPNEEHQVTEGLDYFSPDDNQGDERKTGDNIDVERVSNVEERDFSVHIEGKSRVKELTSESETRRKDTADVCDRDHEGQAETVNKKGSKGGDGGHKPEGETSTIRGESHEGAQDMTGSKGRSVQRSLKRACSDTQDSLMVKKTWTEKEGKKTGESKNRGVQTKRTKNKKSQKKISDIPQTLPVVPADVTDDDRRNGEDVQRGRRSGSSGGVQGEKTRSQKQRQQEIRHKDLSSQVEEDEKKRENVHGENRKDASAGQDGSEGGRKREEKTRKASQRPHVEISKDQSIQHSVERNDSDIQSSSKVRKTGTEPVEEPSDVSRNQGFQRENPDIVELKVAPVSETKKKRTNDKTIPKAAGIKHPGTDRDEEKKTWWHVMFKDKRKQKNDKTMPNVSHVQIEAAVIKDPGTDRSRLMLKEKKKQKTGRCCLSFGKNKKTT